MRPLPLISDPRRTSSADNISSSKAVTVGCLPPFKALFTRRFPTAPQSPIRKRAYYSRSSSSMPRHSPYRLQSRELPRTAKEFPPPSHLDDSKIGTALSDDRASDCMYGSAEAFGSRASTLERHVDAVKALDGGDQRTDRRGCEEGGIRMQHDFVSSQSASLSVMADSEPCKRSSSLRRPLRHTRAIQAVVD